MYAVIFEVEPEAGRRQDYLEIAAQLRARIDFKLTGLVREICDRLSIRRPHRILFVNSRRIGQVARVAFFVANHAAV